MPRLSTLSFALSVVVTLLTVGLALADNPAWDPDPSTITSIPYTGRACNDKTGQAPCAYTVGTCYTTGQGGLPQPNPANNTIVKSVKANDPRNWGQCTTIGAQRENTCTQYSYLDCMYFYAYSQLNCPANAQIVKPDGVTPVVLMLAVPNACRPST